MRACVWGNMLFTHQLWCYIIFISGFSISEKCTICDLSQNYSAVTSWIHLLMFLVIVKYLSLLLSSLFYYRWNMKTMKSINIFSEIKMQTTKPTKQNKQTETLNLLEGWWNHLDNFTQKLGKEWFHWAPDRL